MIAMDLRTLKRLNELGITTVAMTVPKTGTAHVHDIPAILAAVEASGQTDIQNIWLTGTDEGVTLELADGTVIVPEP